MTSYNGDSIVTAPNNHDFVAEWVEAAAYTVSYNANGGSGTMSPSTVYYQEDFVTKKNEFTRKGYTFNGWNEKADGTGTAWGLTNYGVYEYGNGANTWKYSYTKSITLYAQWTPITYYVRYNPNGGTGTMATKSFTFDGTYSKIIESNGFTAPSGLHFAGWKPHNSNDTSMWPVNYVGDGKWKWADGEYQIGSKETHYLDLYAKWVSTYTVTTTMCVTDSYAATQSSTVAGTSLTSCQSGCSGTCSYVTGSGYYICSTYSCPNGGSLSGTNCIRYYPQTSTTYNQSSCTPQNTFTTCNASHVWYTNITCS